MTCDPPSRLADLTPAQRAQLLRHLRQKHVTSARADAIVPHDHHGVAPASYAQQRLWLLHQLDPADPSYNWSASVRLFGHLNSAVLERSLEQIITRHAILRTTFALEDDQLVQRIAPPSPFHLPVEDLMDRTYDEQARLIQSRLAQAATVPFDLEHGPLLRASLLRCSPNDHILVLFLHHIIADGWSTSVLVHEALTLYHAFATDQPSPLAPLPVQYADYAVWQRAWLTGARHARQLSYWQQQLRGPLPMIDLPLDRPRGVIRSPYGATEPFTLPPQLLAQLEALCHVHDVTLSMGLLAVFSVLLGRYARQDDLAIGTPVAGRTRPELAGLIGFFVNTLVLRIDLNGQPSFRQLLQRVREVSLGAYEHQDIPFEQLVDALQVERSVSHTPLFQVLFNVDNTPTLELSSPELRLSMLPAEAHSTAFDLVLFFRPSATSLNATVDYSTDLFDAATITRLIAHFQTLLAHAVTDPDLPVHALPLLPAAERALLLDRWNQTAPSTAPGDPACIHVLIAAQAARQPTTIAVRCGKDALSYAELHGRAAQLARHLRRLGVGPDTRVALCLERSCELIVGMLGILLAGGAYVPLDPSYPPARLVHMLQDAQPQALLTMSTLCAQLPPYAGPTLCLDTDAVALAREDAASLAPVEVGVTGDHLAYVIYTSGSTGTPKGVAVSHRNLVHSTLARERDYTAPVTTYLVTPSFAFDSAVNGIFWTLSKGGTLCLPRDGEQGDPQRLAALIEQHRVSHVGSLIPALYRALLAQTPPAQLQSLNTVIVAGEACPRDLLPEHAQRLPHAALYNEYGPTEGTVWSTVYICPPEEPRPHVPIGRPIPSVQAYVLDAQLQPVPIGVAGELYIGGAGVSRGYLGRPALTAEMFVPDPFGGVPSARLYRTGDLVRWLPDGLLAFLGRIDGQVKLRGYRIELQEIAAVLRRHDAVREAEVVVRADGGSDARLVAYVTITPDQADAAPSADELRELIRHTLPNYMVPSAVVVLATMPLTPNGKLNHAALPAPTLAPIAIVAPRTPLETAMAESWATVLRLPIVGIHDNFFTLGGHSLLATQLIARLRDMTGVELTLRDLFQAPTVAELAQRVTALEPEVPAVLAPIISVSRTEPIPLSYAQQRLWFIDQLQPGSAAYTIPMAVRLRGPLDAAALEHALQTIIARHESLRTTFAVVDGQPVQQIHPTLSVALPLIDLGSQPPAEQAAQVTRYATAAAQHSFDLAQPPLLTAALLQLAADEHVLLVTLHHIVADGWSITVLLRELEPLYAAARSGLPATLPPLPVQYADYAVWERHVLQGTRLQHELHYWRKQLGPSNAGPGPQTEALRLPTDRPRPAMQRFVGAVARRRLPAALAAEVSALSRAEQSTMFITLLAVFGVLLGRYSGQEDISIGTPVANRPRRELDGLIGFFVNTLVLRLDLDGQPSFRQLLQRVREVTLDAYAHQLVPFDMVVEALQPTRSMAQSPLFQVLFAFQPAPSEEAGLADLTLEPVLAHSGTAKFDLTLEITEAQAGLDCLLEYNSDLFEGATVTRLLGHFATLVANLVADPDQPIVTAGLMQSAERNHLLTAWSAPRRSSAVPQTIHHLVEAQAARTPEGSALRWEGMTRSYAALNATANQLAHVLQQRGVGPERRVGVCLERSPDLVVALLAVLKAGGAYVPLDPAYPAERLRWLLDDAQASVLITQHTLAATLALSNPVACEVIDLDRDAVQIAAESTGNLEQPIDPEQLAYVIYTSGSTGTPKGVTVSHANVTRLLAAVEPWFQFGSADVWTLFHAAAFDFSVWELWGALGTGGTLVIVPYLVSRAPDAFYELLVRERVTVLNQTPSAFRQLIAAEALGTTDTLALRYVIFGGEALDVAMLRPWVARHGDEQPQLINMYGITETTVHVTYQRLRTADLEHGRSVIGAAIPDLGLYVLDEQLQPVPIGVPGELYVAGAGLARGYLDRPALTAERFVPSPFNRPEDSRPGARLYRSGDVVRWRPQGTLEYLGRMDQQVKLRGFRIELQEIETVLEEHSGVAAAAVLVHQLTNVASAADQRLVAYVVPAPATVAPALSELRQFLAARLPDYMLPTAVVVLDALPLTPNGKLDRRALSVLNPNGLAHRLDRQQSFVPPRTPTEEMVAAIWAEVLGMEQIGVEDRFFDLGGHSLLVMQVVTRLTAVFQMELSLRSLFERPTVAGIAEYIDMLRWAAQGSLDRPGGTDSTREEDEI